MKYQENHTFITLNQIKSSFFLSFLSPEHPGKRLSTGPAWLQTQPAPWDDPGHPGTPETAKKSHVNKHT